MCLTHRLVVTLGVFGVLVSPAWAAARKGKLAGDGAPESSKERSDYTMCRRKVLLKAKSNPNVKETATKAGLSQCKDEYPAASFLVDCKKSAFSEFAKNSEKLQDALSACKTRFERLNFDPEALVPFYVAGERAYFAGAGMNVARKIDIAAAGNSDDAAEGKGPNDFGNFSCDVAVNMLTDRQSEEYVLFGNHPRDFSGMEEISDVEVKKRLNLAKKAKSGDDYIDYKDQMRVYGELRDETLSVYFPLTYCHFNRKLGNNFQSVKVYYLADKARKALTPYFGISFFRKTKKMPDPKKILTEIIDAMGEGYKVQNSRKGVYFVSKAPIDEFDDEGDPRNVCKQPRSQEFMAILKTDESGTRADYLILSNVANLCKYGDRIVSRIFAKNS